MRVMLDKDAIMPTRAHQGDAGLDIYAPCDIVVPAASEHGLGCIKVDTGVHIEIPYGCVGMIKTKSGINVVRGLLTEGVIDYGYTGSIVVKIYNTTSVPQGFSRGDKITQLVVMPCILGDLDEVDKLEDTERGENGFGSTGV